MSDGRTRLRQWIDRSRLTQREAAAEIGLDVGQLSHILTGRRTPGLNVALRLERATGIPVEAWASTEVDDAHASIADAAESTAVDKA